MKRIAIIAALIVFFIVLLSNYTDIATYIITRFQYKEEVTVFYGDTIEPKDRIADISIAALDSMLASKLEDKKYRFVSLDTKKMGDFSDGEIQMLLIYFKKYSDKVICASLKDLVRMGLCTPIKKDLRGGILLSIDEVIEMTNERVVLKVSSHESGLGGEGYICKLVYKDGKWRVDTMELKHIA